MRRVSVAAMAAMLPASPNFRAMAMKPNFRVAVLGDAHGDFLAGECAVLERVAKPDLFLGVGDFNNEELDIIRRVAAATKDLSGAAHLILGNHDAWRSSRTGTVSETLRAIRDAVSPDLDVAYRRVEVPSATGVFSVVGARPLSWGGGIKATTKKSWALLKELYGVSTPEESTGVITDALLGAVGPAIVVAHQGPAGLGEEAASICGKDWTATAAGARQCGNQPVLRASSANLISTQISVMMTCGIALRRLGPLACPFAALGTCTLLSGTGADDAWSASARALYM